MRLAPLWPTEDKRVWVPIKDVLNVKKGLWPGYPQKPRAKSCERRRCLSRGCSGRVPWNKGRRLSETARENMRKAQKENDCHHPHIETVLTGSCDAMGKGNQEWEGCEREDCATSYRVCPWFVFEGLALYYVHPPSSPIALAPRRN
jgi:hypothetical protein